jgi:hypothetical protein
VTEPAGPDEGWYPDPAGGDGLRWWTGVTWTDATRVATPPSWAPVVPDARLAPTDDATPPPARRRTLVVVVAALMVVVLVAAVVSGLVASLASRTRLDVGAVEDAVAAALTARTGERTTVECPVSVDLEAGSTFVCTATGAEGTTTTVEVHQVDDRGNVTWSVAG